MGTLETFYEDMVAYLQKNSGNFVFVFIIIACFALMTVAILVRTYRSYIVKNWTKYRCNPLIMPIAGAVNESINTGTNFSKCIEENVSFTLRDFFKPILNSFSIVTDTMENIMNAVGEVRSLLPRIRELMDANFSLLSNKLMNLLTSVRILMIKFRHIVNKQVTMMSIMQYIFIVMMLILDFVWVIPRVIIISIIVLWVAIIGVLYIFVVPLAVILNVMLLAFAPFAGIAYACFDGKTQIKMNNGPRKPICEIEVNDRLFGNNRVTGIMKFHFNKHNTTMYNYDNIIVSGGHLVYHNNNWVRIEDLNKNIAQALSNDKYNEEYIYCLNTQNHTFVAGNKIFSDYSELKHNDDNTTIPIVNREIECHLNKTDSDSDTKLIERKMSKKIENQTTGFDKQTQIKIRKNGEMISVPITKILNGMILENGNIVTGTTQQSSNNVQMYKYEGLVVSGSQLVYDTSCRWTRIYRCKSAKRINKNRYNRRFIYNLFTDEGDLTINNISFNDYLETHNSEKIKQIDSYMQSKLRN